jgi:hypothetical protein
MGRRQPKRGTTRGCMGTRVIHRSLLQISHVLLDCTSFTIALVATPPTVSYLIQWEPCRLESVGEFVVGI